MQKFCRPNEVNERQKLQRLLQLTVNEIFPKLIPYDLQCEIINPIWTTLASARREIT